MRKAFSVVMAIFIMTSLAGCDAVQRKFTRKKKYTKPVPRIYQMKKYDVKPSPELYSKHYAYWQSWMSELIQDLGGNHKKDVRCIEEAISQIHDMQNILVPEKAEALEKQIGRLEDIRDTIEKEELSQFNSSRILMDLERVDRTVKRDFDVNGIKNYVKESFDDLQPDQVASEAQTESKFGASLPRYE